MKILSAIIIVTLCSGSGFVSGQYNLNDLTENAGKGRITFVD